MKVLHLVPSIPPPEFVVKDLAYSKKIANIETKIMKVRRSGGWKRLPIVLFRMLLQAFRIFKMKPHVIHCHFISTTVPAALSGCPSIVTVHESFDWYPFWWKSMIKLAARRCEIVYISHHNHDMWNPILGKQGKVIYHAIDTEIYNPKRYDREARNSLLNELDVESIIMLMGPFTQTRAYHLAIKATHRLRSKGMKLGVVFKGYGGKAWYREYLTNLAIKLDVPMKMITKRLSELELAELYAISDIFIRPGVAEGFGIAVLEAQGCGTPVIVSNCASLKEVFRSSSLRFEPMDVDDLVGNIEKLLTDDEIRSRLIGSGLENARSLSWQKKIQSYLKAYKRAIES